jgi:hypothetical protein
VEVSGFARICLPPEAFPRQESFPSGPGSRSVTLCGFNSLSPPSLTARRPRYLNPHPPRRRGSCAFTGVLSGRFASAPLSARKVCNSIFSRSKSADSKKRKTDTSSYCCSVQDRSRLTRSCQGKSIVRTEQNCRKSGSLLFRRGSDGHVRHCTYRRSGPG